MILRSAVAALLLLCLGCVGARAADEPATLDLSATQGKGGTPLALGLAWSVARLGPGDARTPIVTGLGEARPHLRLPPGDYWVEARLDRARQGQGITLGPGETRALVVAVAAGRLAMAARLGAGGPLVIDGVAWEIRPASDPAAPPLARFGVARPSLVLDAGSWRIGATAGAISAETVVAVRTGGNTDLDLVFAAGRVRPVALQGGTRVALERGVGWRFERVGDGTGPASIARDGSRPVILLPVGRWKAMADAPGGWSGEVEIDIAEGEDRILELPLTR